MKKLIFAALLFVSLPAQAQQYERGYERQNGTYVQPHYQSAPDGNPYNNYSTRGNENPYTGQQGTVNPQPSQNSYNSLNSGSDNNRFERQQESATRSLLSR